MKEQSYRDIKCEPLRRNEALLAQSRFELEVPKGDWGQFSTVWLFFKNSLVINLTGKYNAMLKLKLEVALKYILIKVPHGNQSGFLQECEEI